MFCNIRFYIVHNLLYECFFANPPYSPIMRYCSTLFINS